MSSQTNWGCVTWNICYLYRIFTPDEVRKNNMYDSSTIKIHEGVSCQDDIKLDEFCILGYPSKNASGNLVIGFNAHIRSSAVVYAGTKIGDNFHLGHGSLVRENCKICSNVSIGSHSILEHQVVIGDNVRLHSRVYIPEFSIVEDSVWIGPGCVLTNAPYPNSPDAKLNLKGVHLLEGAIVGAGAIILPGVRIGRKALIGAGSVVTDDVEDGAVVVGSPAKKTKHIAEIQAYSNSK